MVSPSVGPSSLTTMSDQELNDNLDMLQDWIKKAEENLRTIANQLEPLWVEKVRRELI